MIRLSTVTEAHVAREVGFAEAPEHPQVRLEQGKQALGSLLAHLAARLFLLGVLDALVHVTL